MDKPTTSKGINIVLTQPQSDVLRPFCEEADNNKTPLFGTAWISKTGDVVFEARVLDMETAHKIQKTLGQKPGSYHSDNRTVAVYCPEEEED